MYQMLVYRRKYAHIIIILGERFWSDQIGPFTDPRVWTSLKWEDRRWIGAPDWRFSEGIMALMYFLTSASVVFCFPTN